MTLKTNARIAGSMFLLYIAVGVAAMVVSPATSGDDVATKLGGIAQHAGRERMSMMLGFATSFIAITLGVALYGMTREEDHDLAVLALMCRVAEGIGGVIPILATLGLLNLAAGPTSSDGNALANYLFKVSGWNVYIAATYFAVGSTIFCWLLLRARLIPVRLAWLGVIASALLVIALPLRLAGLLSSTIINLLWVPMAVFEIPLGLWLMFRFR